VRRASVVEWLGAITLVLCLVPLLVFRWVDFSLSRELYGYAFSIFGYAREHPSFIAGSFGVIAAVLFIAGAAAIILRKPNIQCTVATALFVILEWAYLRLSLGDSNLLVELLRQSNSWLIIVGLPAPSATVEPGVWHHLYFDTIADRLVLGWYYLGLGWYVALIATAYLFVNGVRELSRRLVGRILTVFLACTLILVAFFLYGPVRAEQAFVAAVRKQSEGRPMEAIELYRQAMDLDTWYSWNPQIYGRIGQAYASLGRTDTPEYAIYDAERIFAQNQGKAFIGDLPYAIDQYELVASAGGKIGVVARMRADDIRLTYGLHLFQVGAFGSAVREWESVLRTEPYNWLAAYYVGLGYPSLNQYPSLLEVSQRFLAECGDPVAIGIFSNRLGDAHTRLGDLDTAHRDYFKSYHIDYTRNRAGISALVGP
jgi:tetratricopeptide (TPR) repeat protein